MLDTLVEQERATLTLSTARDRVDIDIVLGWLHRSHWAAEMRRETFVRAIENSICVGVYEGARQLAFARAVTDLATYAYLTDVIVDEASRGRGIGSWMVECFLAHPDLQGLRRIALFSRDAAELYVKHGFGPMPASATYLEIKNPSPRATR